VFGAAQRSPHEFGSIHRVNEIGFVADLRSRCDIVGVSKPQQCLQYPRLPEPIERHCCQHLADFILTYAERIVRGWFRK